MVGHAYRVPVSYGANLFAQEYLPDDADTDDGAQIPGPTVVLAHGWCMDHSSWHRVVDALLSRLPVRIVTYDQRGHGKSTMGVEHEPSVRILGDDLAEVIDATTPDGPLIVVGHSMGGMSVMAYAGIHDTTFTQRVRGVVLASTAASIEGRDPVPLETLIMAVASRAPGIPPRLLVPRLVQGRLLFGQGADRADVAHAIDQIKRTKMPTIGRFFYAISQHNEAESLAHFVRVPTHIISGDHDRLIPVAYAEALRDLIPSSHLRVLPGAGHMTPYEAVDVIVDAVIDLIETTAD